MHKYSYLFRFLLGVLQFTLALLAFKYYEQLTVIIIFVYPVLLILIQDWKNKNI